MNQIACDICEKVVKPAELIQLAWNGHVKHASGGITTEPVEMDLCSNACLLIAIRERGGAWG